MNGAAQGQAARALGVIGGSAAGDTVRAATLHERVTTACANLEGLYGTMDALYCRVAAVNRAEDGSKRENTPMPAMPFENTVLRLEHITARLSDIADKLQMVA